MADRTDQSNPVVELQRRLFDESRQLLIRNVEAQQFTNRLLMNSLNAQELVQRHSIELANATAHSYLTGATVLLADESDADRLHNLVDEEINRLFGVYTDAFDAFTRQLERNLNTTEDRSTEYAESVEDQFDRLLDTDHRFKTQPIEVE